MNRFIELYVIRYWNDKISKCIPLYYFECFENYKFTNNLFFAWIVFNKIYLFQEIGFHDRIEIKPSKSIIVTKPLSNSTFFLNAILNYIKKRNESRNIWVCELLYILQYNRFSHLSTLQLLYCYNNKKYSPNQ